jgi:hypothetical protein
MLGKPAGVVFHRRHAGDAHDVGLGRQRQPGGLVAAQEGAIEHPHVVPRRLQGGGYVGDAERREAKARAVEPAAKERVDEQYRRQDVLSTRTS